MKKNKFTSWEDAVFWLKKQPDQTEVAPGLPKSGLRSLFEQAGLGSVTLSC